MFIALAVILLALIALGVLFVWQCITRGFGSIKGQPLSPRWWIVDADEDEAIYLQHQELSK